MMSVQVYLTDASYSSVQYQDWREDSVSKFPEKMYTNKWSSVLSFSAVGGSIASEAVIKTSERITASAYQHLFKDMHKSWFADRDNISH